MSPSSGSEPGLAARTVLPRASILWFVVATMLLGAAFTLSLTFGALAISLSDVAGWALGRLPDDDLSARVLSGVRLPRTLTAVAVGATLGVAGAALQGIHRTQVVDAHLLGVSAASGIGVALGFALAPSDLRLVAPVVLGALAGALYSLASRRLGSAGGGSTIVILMGIAAGLAMTAWTGIFVLAIDSPAVPTLSFFIFGSLAGAQWLALFVAVPLIVIAGVVLWWLAPGLDLMALGEDVSVHLGFDARRRVPVALAAIGVATGAAVALGGVIGFVGLIVPLAIRPLLGPVHRVLIPASAIGGAIAVLLVDTASRTLVSPVELPIGLLTAAIGGPVLVWLVRRETVQ